MSPFLSLLKLPSSDVPTAIAVKARFQEETSLKQFSINSHSAQKDRGSKQGRKFQQFRVRALRQEFRGCICCCVCVCVQTRMLLVEVAPTHSDP